MPSQTSKSPDEIKAEAIAEAEALLGFSREGHEAEFDAALANLQDEHLTQALADAVVVNEETGERMSLEAYAAKLLSDASQAGVNIEDTISAVKELTGRMTTLRDAFPELARRADEDQSAEDTRYQTLERQLLQHCTGKKGHRLTDCPPVYFTEEFSGVIAIQSPVTGEVAVVWREHDRDVPLSNGQGTYPVFTIVGIARNVDEDEARSMLTDAMAAKSALWNDQVQGWGWAPPVARENVPEQPF